MCLASKLLKYKPYSYLQSLLVLTHCWKDFSIDFVTKVPISTNWKGEIYDTILVIVEWLLMMIYYKSIKVTIDAPAFTEIMI